MPARRGLYGGPRAAGFSTRRLDAAGQRNRQRRFEESLVQEEQERKANAERQRRIDEAYELGKIPVLTSVQEIIDLQQSSTSKQPEFPAYQVSSEVELGLVMSAVFPGKQPNVEANRRPKENVGPHFDHYFEDFDPWVVHVNKTGKGVVRAWFLSDENFGAYRRIASQVDIKKPEVQDLLAEQRSMIAKLQIVDDEPLAGPIEKGTTTLIWQGLSSMMSRSFRLGHDAAPSIHEFERDGGTGSYALYAHQTGGRFVPEGFDVIE